MQPNFDRAGSPEVRTESSKSLGELFSEFTRETSLLVRQEVELGRLELTANAKRAGLEATYMAVGGLVAYLGVGGLVAGAILGLGEALPYWASALIIGGAVTMIGAGLALYGQQRIKRLPLAPHRTLESVKQSAITLKEHARWNPETRTEAH